MATTNQNPLVSVVIPSYNRASLIPRCLDSVFAQTYHNIEVIVVDDGSIDNTEEVLSGINDKRLKVLKLQKNSGMCSARNAGARIATGSYIACHDTDDIWDANKIRKQVEFATRTNYDLMFCAMRRIYSDGSEVVYPKQTFKMEENIQQQLLMGNFVSSITLFMKRELGVELGFSEDVRRFTDWDFVMHALKAGYTLGYLNEVLATAYVQKDSSSMIENTHNAVEAFYQNFQSDIDSYKPAQAKFQYMLATTSSTRKEALPHYWKSLITNFNIKVLIKCILCFLGLYNTKER